MRVVVAIPWRPQPDRVYAHGLTVARYRELLPNTETLSVDTDHQPFCLAGCRNKGVRLAEDLGADVVVIGDADTLPEREPLLAAIEGAARNGKVNLPYTAYWSLRGDGTAQYRRGVPLHKCNHFEVPGACSGVLVATPATWRAVGGQDERFLGWGAEDAAFYSAHVALLGSEPVRHPGRVYSLTHESATKEGPQYSANFALCFRYQQAQGDPDAMRALIAEREAVDAERAVGRA
ncbi:galactosyltransferase-related protein [Sphaerisporangium sp. TRM90804]|uniref:galactosyltransferase-related protein n=1 Tax=Sphaerisporangium sp. TRM90804 TaxID=3031113 RepID=UPI00244BCD34|nr:galactosyltransferase-related protein [Sphaerisporangium sp. TRM90804]MDH2424756.1 galactosyltransferase-related protein [Sphaerisporangium sp. TRM90804]